MDHFRIANASWVVSYGSHVDIHPEAVYFAFEYLLKKHIERAELLQDALDLPTMRTLLMGSARSRTIAMAIEFNSEEVLQVELGLSLSAAALADRWTMVAVEEGASVRGRSQLGVETNKWETLAGEIARILRLAEEDSQCGVAIA